jgi:hypothetical protein
MRPHGLANNTRAYTSRITEGQHVYASRTLGPQQLTETLNELKKHTTERGVKLLASVDISTRAPWITLNEQHIMAC